MLLLLVATNLFKEVLIKKTKCRRILDAKRHETFVRYDYENIEGKTKHDPERLNDQASAN
jgi:hypothetical protein